MKKFPALVAIVVAILAALAAPASAHPASAEVTCPPNSDKQVLNVSYTNQFDFDVHVRADVMGTDFTTSFNAAAGQTGSGSIALGVTTAGGTVRFVAYNGTTAVDNVKRTFDARNCTPGITTSTTAAPTTTTPTTSPQTVTEGPCFSPNPPASCTPTTTVAPCGEYGGGDCTPQSTQPSTTVVPAAPSGSLPHTGGGSPGVPLAAGGAFALALLLTRPTPGRLAYYRAERRRRTYGD